MKTYVIGDVAGEFKALMALMEKCRESLEKDEPHRFVLVGDVIDRGPQSKEVVEFLMAHPEHVCLMGNHEDLMLHDLSTWLWNGGDETLKSFGGEIPQKVLDWTAKLPWSHVVEIDGKKFYISHAPVPDPDRRWYESPVELWNRYQPKPDPQYDLQISGHNSHWGLRWFVNGEGKQFAVCIDDSRKKVLTALELPTLKVIQQPYLA